MLVFGVSSRVVVSSRHGQFFCPTCQVSTTFAHATWKRALHIFRLPVATLSEEPGGIMCLTCRGLYPEDAIDAKPEQNLKTWKCPKCSRDWPETNVRCAICRVRSDGWPA